MFSRIVNSFSSALELNVATLSGCADVIVVPQEDGRLRSTPFHVRFGKTKLLKSREKEVPLFSLGHTHSTFRLFVLLYVLGYNHRERRANVFENEVKFSRRSFF